MFPITPPKFSPVEAMLRHIEPMFTFALIWSVGATTDVHGRQKFDHYLRVHLLQLGMREVPPEKGLVYDYLYGMNWCSTDFCYYSYQVSSFCSQVFHYLYELSRIIFRSREISMGRLGLYYRYLHR